jgi:hypothetical protein
MTRAAYWASASLSEGATPFVAEIVRLADLQGIIEGRPMTGSTARSMSHAADDPR